MPAFVLVLGPEPQGTASALCHPWLGREGGKEEGRKDGVGGKHLQVLESLGSTILILRV